MEHRNLAYLLEDVMKNKFDRAVYQEDLWEYVKHKPIKTYRISDVKHWVYTPCWSFKQTNYFYSVYQVLLQKKQFSKEIKRIKRANVSYPLIITEDKFDKFGTILDGHHRFAKLIMRGKHKKIKVQFIPRNDLMKLMVKC